MDDLGRLEARVAALFTERLHLAAPAPDADLFAEGVLDSLYFVELLLRLEREFGLTIAPEDVDLDRFRSIAGIARFVAARRMAAAHAAR